MKRLCSLVLLITLSGCAAPVGVHPDPDGGFGGTGLPAEAARSGNGVVIPFQTGLVHHEWIGPSPQANAASRTASE